MDQTLHAIVGILARSIATHRAIYAWGRYSRSSSTRVGLEIAAFNTLLVDRSSNAGRAQVVRIGCGCRRKVIVRRRSGHCAAKRGPVRTTVGKCKRAFPNQARRNCPRGNDGDVWRSAAIGVEIGNQQWLHAFRSDGNIIPRAVLRTGGIVGFRDRGGRYSDQFCSPDAGKESGQVGSLQGDGDLRVAGTGEVERRSCGQHRWRSRNLVLRQDGVDHACGHRLSQGLPRGVGRVGRNPRIHKRLGARQGSGISGTLHLAAGNIQRSYVNRQRSHAEQTYQGDRNQDDRLATLFWTPANRDSSVAHKILSPYWARSRAMVFSICFRLKAPPKSKIPTTKTTSRGRATANSSNCEPEASARNAALSSPP